MNRLNGVVLWFDDAKGYGFIKGEGSEDSFFVHWKNVRMKGHRTLNKGDRVSFEDEILNGKHRAVKVVVEAKVNVESK